MSLKIMNVDQEIEFLFENGFKLTINAEFFSKDKWTEFLTENQCKFGFSTSLNSNDEAGWFLMTKLPNSHLHIEYDSACGVKFEFTASDWEAEFKRIALCLSADKSLLSVKFGKRLFTKDLLN